MSTFFRGITETVAFRVHSEDFHRNEIPFPTLPTEPEIQVVGGNGPAGGQGGGEVAVEEGGGGEGGPVQGGGGGGPVHGAHP
jgi:hypothetical protein